MGGARGRKQRVRKEKHMENTPWTSFRWSRGRQGGGKELKKQNKHGKKPSHNGTRHEEPDAKKQRGGA